MSNAVYSGKGINVYALDDGKFVASDYQVWLPGVYASVKTAIKATEVDCHELDALWEAMRPTPITLDDVALLKEAGHEVKA